MLAIPPLPSTAMPLPTLRPPALIIPALLALSLGSAAHAQTADAIRSGTLVFTVAEAEPVEIARVRTDVSVEIHGIFAHVEVRQRFRNPSGLAAEGIYAFPIPADGAIDHLVIKQDGRVLSDVHRTVNAQQLYARTVSRLQRAAIRSSGQAQPAVFRAPVSDIAPHATLDITIGYLQVVEHQSDRHRLRVPLAANTNPLPDLSLEDGLLEAAPASHLLPMASRTEAGNSDAKPHADAVSVRVSMVAGGAVTGILSRHHPIKVSGQEQVVIVTSGDTTARRDFELEWRPDARQLRQLPLAKADARSAQLVDIAVR